MNSEDNTKGTTSCDSLSSIHQDFDQIILLSSIEFIVLLSFVKIN